VMTKEEIEWPYKDCGNFQICPMGKGNKVSFDLDVDYIDVYYGGTNTTSVDALEVYKALKEYFKGTEYD